jgi:hypothetical protein
MNLIPQPLSASLLPLLLSAASAFGQQPQPDARALGTVATTDATVTGVSSVSNGIAILAGHGTVTAKDHTAEMNLSRGGKVRVCSTSGLHVTAGAAPAGETPPLMLALDRGAMEIAMQASITDVVMTPDLRLSIKDSGPLDLRIRVTPNGDTCVENRVAQSEAKSIAQAVQTARENAPEPGATIAVSSLFGDQTYEIHPGQRVLFEHADLHQVVDHESSPCGCPAELTPAHPAVPVDGTLLPGQKVTGFEAAEQHPFPAAVSQGLAPPPPTPAVPPNTTHAQVATTLQYSANDTAPEAHPTIPEPPMAFTQPQPPPKPSDNQGGFFHRLGRFFKHLF